MRLGASKGFPCFAGKLGNDEVVGSLKKSGKLRGRKRVTRFERDPFGASKIRRGNDAGALGEFGEIFRRDFEREANGSGDERGDGKHFAAHLEEEIVSPLDLLGGPGEGKADFAELVDVHGATLTVCGKRHRHRRPV